MDHASESHSKTTDNETYKNIEIYDNISPDYKSKQLQSQGCEISYFVYPAFGTFSLFRK